MYRDRVEELIEQRIPPHAEGVAELFGNDSERGIIEQEIERTIESINANQRLSQSSPDSVEVVETLKDLGFIWGSKGDPALYEPGIPSLMNYVLAIAKEREEHTRS